MVFIKRSKTRKACGEIAVRALSSTSSQGLISIGPLRFPCALGRSGMTRLKREGDGATPSGRFAVREVLYRADRGCRPRTRRPVRSIRRNYGWCDAVGDRNYNRMVLHPYPASAEHLWREDTLYDLVAVLDYNVRPRVQGRGSAIFLHVARTGLRPTEGCIALRRFSLELILASIGGDAVIKVGTGQSTKKARSRSSGPKWTSAEDTRSGIIRRCVTGRPRRGA
jgi:L,D-peptidoglycan transpeptidase YkuD (ErfK/YbiS/YcfS/YnhG family)